tara:strand:+ start:554 stop:988 length:435 start_codon:yes stop_codon:yes gene_type:complete
MNIFPLKGIEEFHFGAYKSDIQKSLGHPDEINNLDAEDGVSSEIYRYKSLGLDLYFDKDTDFRLWGIGINDSSARLKGVTPIGLSEKELLQAFPDLKLDVCDGDYKEYIYPEQEIEFYLKFNTVNKIMVNPNLDEYFNKYSHQA